MAADELPIVLDRSAEAPLAVQVADALRAAAAGGVLRVGERLSSTRALAARLRVSRSVVAAAYDQLLAEGWLVGRRGSGTYLAAAPNTSTEELTSAPRPATAPPAAQVDLNSGRPCLEALDRAAWRRAWRAAADRRPDTVPDYSGRPEFRRAVVEHLLRHRGLNAHPDQVLATAGVTAGLHEVAARLPPGAAVAMEEPGYQRAANALLSRGLRVVPAEMDDDGLRVDRLPAGLAAVYCTPAHQFPLGSRLPADRRVALVERARAENFLVIEDDYDGELRYDVAPLPLLVALGPDVVAHLGTASKLLTPTLGVGWLVAPPALHAGVLAARERCGSRPSPAGQLVFAGLAEYGDLARHLRRLRATLAVRREMVIEEMAGSGAPVLGDAAGAHLRVGLPSAAAERAVVAGADAAGVLVPPLGDYHLGPARVFGVSVGYAGPGTAELRRAVRVVADLVGEAWSGQ